MTDAAFRRWRSMTLLLLAATITSLMAFGFSGLRKLDDWNKQQVSALRVGTLFTLQAQAHLARLMVDLERVRSGDMPLDREALLLQFEVVWSRVDVLRAEEGRSFFLSWGAIDRFVANSQHDLAAVEPLMARLEPDDLSALPEIMRHLGRFARRLADLSTAIHRERTAAVQETDARGAELLERFVATLLGVVATGAVLVVLLVQAVRLQERHLHQSRCAERRAAEAERDLRAVIDALPAAVAAIDRQGRYLFINQLHATFYGPAACGPAEPCTPGEPRDTPTFHERLVIDESGASRVLLATEVPLTGAGGALDRTVRIALDITERKRAEDRVRFLAERDALTGLPNRASLMAQLEAQLARQPEPSSLALLLVDLDDFKGVNDTFGHAAGDTLLLHWADRLQAFLGEAGGLACRLGGDEFAILATGLGGKDAALDLAERLGQRLAQPFLVAGTTVQMSASIGIAVAPEDGSLAADLLRHADVALYAAKRSGRRRAQLFTGELAAQHQHRKLLEVSLRQALAGEPGLRLDYQPKRALEDGELVGFEALLRWDHPRFGPLAPAVFVPTAEETGLIGALGAWVIEETLHQIARWDKEGIGAGLSVAVNLSAAQLVYGDVVTATLAAIEAAGVAPSRLKVEVTESILMRDAARAAEILTQFRQAGIGVAIDDFGTGFSSLSYLVRLPFDELKIDRSFVLAMCDSAAALAVVRSVMDLAKSLGALVVAEGIETAEQLDLLRGLGCDQGQGYLLGRPGSPDEAARVMQRARGAFEAGSVVAARPEGSGEARLGVCALGELTAA